MNNRQPFLFSNTNCSGLKCNAPPKWVSGSPWTDRSKSNLFRDEFQFAEENSSFSGFRPLPIYKWIYSNKGEEIFFRALARYAPMFPVFAYRGQIAGWISPPPSGSGNTIFIVMGHDSHGKLRVVGGNYFNFPRRKSGLVPLATDFFDQYDNADYRIKKRLIADVIERSVAEDGELLQNVLLECEHFHTMPICMVALTKRGQLFHAAKAVIDGVKPADFSYEYFGEIE